MPCAAGWVLSTLLPPPTTPKQMAWWKGRAGKSRILCGPVWRERTGLYISLGSYSASVQLLRRKAAFHGRTSFLDPLRGSGLPKGYLHRAVIIAAAASGSSDEAIDICSAGQIHPSAAQDSQFRVCQAGWRVATSGTLTVQYTRDRTKFCRQEMSHSACRFETVRRCCQWTDARR